MASRCNGVTTGAPIEVFALNKAFNEDNHPKKANLSAGVYRTEEGLPWVLPCVRKTENIMANDETLDHEYLPVLGLESFCKAATTFLLGENCPQIQNGTAFGIQSLSGTGALRVAAEFLSRQLKYTTFYYSEPTWGNHGLVFKNAGFKDERTYRYWNQETRSLDFDGMVEDLNNAPENAVIILHVCAHNPTGCDPTQDQWKKICDLIQERRLFPLFDCAYQGFASGDPEQDAWSVRYFVSRGLELMCAQSFAKNFGLYNERVGNLTFVVNNKNVVVPVKSQVTLIIRAMYSNPPHHGARIVTTIFQNPELQASWKECIVKMSSRVREMREKLRSKLEQLGTPGRWDHITSQIGLFSYTGLSERQVDYIISKYHVFLMKSGRINICGLNDSNVEYIAAAIDDAVKKFPSPASNL